MITVLSLCIVAKSERDLLLKKKKRFVALSIIVVFDANNLFISLQRKRAKLAAKEEQSNKQAAAQNLKWEIYFLITNGGNPDGQTPIKTGVFLLMLFACYKWAV